MTVVITGTGRCGTGYIARVLQLCGIEVGHEAVYGPTQALGWDDIDWRTLDGDASWLALPLLTTHEGPTFLQVRHPLATLPSLVATGLFGDDRTDNYSRVIAKHAPECLASPTEIERAAAFWTMWNRWALTQVDSWWRVEDVDVDVLARIAEAIGRVIPEPAARSALTTVPRDYNGRHRPAVDIPAGVTESIADLAAVLGYEV